MIKGLLLSLSVIASSIGMATRPVQTTLGEDLKPQALNYVQEIEYYDEEQTMLLGMKRTYEKGCEYFSVEKHFKAPGGFVYELTMSDEQRDAFVASLDDAPELSFRMVSFVYYREVNGFPFYVDSDTDWISDDIVTFGNRVQSFINGYVIGEVLEDATPAILSGKFEIEAIYRDSDVFRFVFPLEDIQIEPFKIDDVFHPTVNYYKREGEERITVWAYLDDDVFNDKFGYITDDRYTSEDGSFVIDYYTVDFYANDSIHLLKLGHDEPTKSIEFEKISVTPTTISAIATVVSGGKEYTFSSKSVLIEKPDFEILIDGFDNRSTVGKGVEHQLSVNFDKVNLEFFDIDYWDVEFSLTAINKKTGDEETLVTNVAHGEIGKLTRITEDFYTLNFKLDEVGEYDMRLDFVNTSDELGFVYYLNFPLECTLEEPYHVPDNEIFTIKNRGENPSINAITNGEDIIIETSIDPTSINSKGIVNYSFETSRSGVIEVVESDGTYTVRPIAPGNVTLTMIANSDTFENLRKSISIHVVDDFTSVYNFVYEDGFHQSKEDFDVSLTIGELSDIENAVLEWTVVDAEGNPCAFTLKNRNTITLLEPPTGDYTISCAVNGNIVGSTTIAFRAMDMNKFVRANILWIFLIAIAFMSLMIAIRTFISKPRSLDKRIEKAYEAFSSLDPKSESTYIAGLKRVKGMLGGALAQAEDLNIDSHNQYEKIIRYIKKTISSIKVLIKDDSNLPLEEKGIKIGEITDTSFKKTLALAKEMGDAQAMIEANHRQANLNNYAKVDSAKKIKSNKKEKTPVAPVMPVEPVAPIEETEIAVENNEDVIRCPICGSHDFSIIENGEYLCNVCNKTFKLDEEVKVADSEDAPAGNSDGSVEENQ